MKSFGPLLKKLRGRLARSELAKRAGIPEPRLAAIERGRALPTPSEVSRALAQGLGYSEDEVVRLMLEVELFDYGLTDPDIRQLVIDLIDGHAPPEVEAELKRLYRRYASSDEPPPPPPSM